jgi:DNA-binding IclR family transcriptional regulator
MTSRKNSGATTAARILSIVSDREPVTLSDVTAAMDLTIGTVHTYAQSLIETGLLESTDEGYRLSPQFVVYGDRVRFHRPLYRCGKPQVEDLVADTGETALVMLEHGGRECILYEAFGADAVGTDYYERNRGEPQPLYCTASGKAVLAHLPADEREQLLKSTTFEDRAPNTITDPTALREELATIREEGVAYNDEEQLQGLRAVAAPVVTGDTVHGAISIGGPRSRVDGERFRSTFPELVTEAANVVEVEMQAAE